MMGFPRRGSLGPPIPWEKLHSPVSTNKFVGLQMVCLLHTKVAPGTGGVSTQTIAPMSEPGDGENTEAAVFRNEAMLVHL